jgi:uncharacterized protein (DUF885 family)
MPVSLQAMSDHDGSAEAGGPAQEQLARLGDEYFDVVHTASPFNATELGATGFDALVPDPSREGSARTAGHIARIESRLSAIDPSLLGEQDQVNHAVLAHLAAAARSDLEHGLWEANASAEGYVAPQAIMFQAVPTALLSDASAADGYLRRLSGLASYLDAATGRYREALGDGRVSTQVGTRQAIDQIENHLRKDIADDMLLTVRLPPDVDQAAFRAEAAGIITGQVRPALRRLLTCLQDELLPAARPDERVGIRYVPGGTEGYLAAVARHTTTGLSPEEIHQTGLDVLAALQDEWAELGRNALGLSHVPSILDRLREDPALRFRDSAQIVATVSDALRRAEDARGR